MDSSDKLSQIAIRIFTRIDQCAWLKNGWLLVQHRFKELSLLANLCVTTKQSLAWVERRQEKSLRFETTASLVCIATYHIINTLIYLQRFPSLLFLSSHPAVLAIGAVPYFGAILCSNPLIFLHLAGLLFKIRDFYLQRKIHQQQEVICKEMLAVKSSVKESEYAGLKRAYADQKREFEQKEWQILHDVSYERKQRYSRGLAADIAKTLTVIAEIVKTVFGVIPGCTTPLAMDILKTVADLIGAYKIFTDFRKSSTWKVVLPPIPSQLNHYETINKIPLTKHLSLPSVT